MYFVSESVHAAEHRDLFLTFGQATNIIPRTMLFALCLDLPSGGLLTRSLIPPRQRVVFLSSLLFSLVKSQCSLRIFSVRCGFIAVMLGVLCVLLSLLFSQVNTGQQLSAQCHPECRIPVSFHTRLAVELNLVLRHTYRDFLSATKCEHGNICIENVRCSLLAELLLQWKSVRP